MVREMQGRKAGDRQPRVTVHTIGEWDPTLHCRTVLLVASHLLALLYVDMLLCLLLYSSSFAEYPFTPEARRMISTKGQLIWEILETWKTCIT